MKTTLIAIATCLLMTPVLNSWLQTTITSNPEFTITCPQFLLIGDSQLVRVNMSTGEVTYGKDYKPDAAARIFWEAMGRAVKPCVVEGK